MLEDMPFRVPNPSELVELIEKQDEVMIAIQNELEACKENLNSLKMQQEKSYGDLPDQIVSEADSRLQTALEALERLQRENINLEDEVDDLKQRLLTEKPVASVLNLKEQLKELEFELERTKRTESFLTTELDDERKKREKLGNEFEVINKNKQSMVTSLTLKVEELEEACANAKLKLEESLSEKDSEVGRLHIEKDLISEKANHMNALCEQYVKEISHLRRDLGASKSRISILTQENMRLRMQKMKNTPENEQPECSKEVAKLLSDQSHLIAALREESKLLTERLEIERKENKLKVKSLRSENAELQQRLDKLLRLG